LGDNQGTRVLGIVGPTGVGKTGVALELCKRLKGEIISCDSRQIIKGLDIGTAKPLASERARAKHHLIDLIELGEDFSVHEYREMAVKTIEDIYSRGKQPIVVGGAGLYYKALVEGFFETPPKDDDFRKKMEDAADKYGADHLRAKLEKIDPEAARKILGSDTFRLIRVLEIYHTTGRTKSELEKSGEYPQQSHEFITIGLNLQRKVLYSRIDARVDKMLENGWIEELKALIETSRINSRNIGKIMGYNNLYQHVSARMGFSECVAKIKQAHRNYAKRQITWFKRTKGIIWLNTDDPSIVEKIMELFKLQ
jgi:tRNA dimethylallyltransferase